MKINKCYLNLKNINFINKMNKYYLNWKLFAIQIILVMVVIDMIYSACWFKWDSFFDKNKTIFIHSDWSNASNTKIAKNVKDEFVNKLKALKLIAYNGKIPTNNMITSKSLKYPCFWTCNVDAHVIDWIYNWLKSIFQ